MKPCDKAQFHAAWTTLAAEGACDGHGSAEYRRVLAEWEKVGCPMPPHGFIYWRANIGPADHWTLVDPSG